MITVVADSNIYISAIVFGGVPRDVINLSEQGEFELLISPMIVSEVEHVLASKFAWEQRRVRRICRPLWRGSRQVDPLTEVSACRDSKDNHLLALAIDGQAKYLISGDTDLLVLKTFESIPIITAARFLAEKVWLSGSDKCRFPAKDFPPNA